MIMKKLTVLTVVPAALALASGSVVAVPPTGFSYDDYTVNGGVITAGCPVGYTCTNLDATGNGILQQRVTDGTDSYFRTIIVDENVTATDLASVQALGFRDESYVGATDGSGDMSTRGIVQSGTPADLANYLYVMAEITDGQLNVNGLSFEQFNGLGAANRNVEFKGFGNSNNLTMQINVMQPNNEGNMTIRKATATTAGTLSLSDADPGIADLAYASGNRLQVVWLEQAASGTGDAFNRILGQQIYSNLTAGTEIRYNNADGAGNFVAVNTGANNEVGGIGPWNWNAALFGNEPNPYLVNGAGTGIALPGDTFP
jgi:hypothetical protein